jgi:acetylglutamate kinase
MRVAYTVEMQKVLMKQVGEPAMINVMVLEQLRRADVIPVVAPIGFGVNDELTYNINADTSAGAIAGAMKAKRLLFLTDVPGVLDKNGQLIPEMTVEQARALIADGTISGGMIPKVENCIDAVSRGVEAATIMDGRVPHCLLLEVFTEAGVGTMVKRR